MSEASTTGACPPGAPHKLHPAPGQSDGQTRAAMLTMALGLAVHKCEARVQASAAAAAAAMDTFAHHGYGPEAERALEAAERAVAGALHSVDLSQRFAAALHDLGLVLQDQHQQPGPKQQQLAAASCSSGYTACHPVPGATAGGAAAVQGCQPLLAGRHCWQQLAAALQGSGACAPQGAAAAFTHEPLGAVAVLVMMDADGCGAGEDEATSRWRPHVLNSLPGQAV